MRRRERLPTSFLIAIAVGLVAGLAHAAGDAREPREPQKKQAKPAESGRIDAGVLAGIGFPRPLAIEPVVGVDKTLLFGAEYGFLPTTTIASVDARMWSLSADVRWFPFRGSFYLGLRAGHQRITAETTLTAARVGSYTETVEVGTWFVNPKVGFLWRLSPFVIGLDVGAQLPIATSASRSSLLAVAAPEIDADIATATNTLGRTVLPTIDLLRVGLVF